MIGVIIYGIGFILTFLISILVVKIRGTEDTYGTCLGIATLWFVMLIILPIHGLASFCKKEIKPIRKRRDTELKIDYRN